ncbi:hypothetical protein C0Q70_09748 [Pomacea canaliculata]|uniref:non-specific serine/threonine protein kinase n=1 Tax=Pomacea canaliculata TaxID=400727 RepID=A0A2T7PAP7_POMCA|nr:hypothetical protein C0Q70_09748 [Pomacea canaliculata]
MGCMCGKESLHVENKRYFIRSRLGEGGFSYVDLVEESSTRKLFALKRLTCHSKEEENVALQEVEIMRRISHPNVVPLVGHMVVQVGHHSKTMDIVSEVFIVMPYYSRGSLQDLIDRHAQMSKVIPEGTIWAHFLGICKGVGALHHHSPPYAHRDLKPGNIMMMEDGTPVVMDLGSATVARWTLSHSGKQQLFRCEQYGLYFFLFTCDLAAERCSMPYRPPELFTVETNSSVDERTDIWSLGCTLYAMAYLESPFDKVYQTGGSIALAAMAGKINFREGLRCSQDLREMISWLMNVNPRDRPFIDQVIQKVESLSSTAARPAPEYNQC